MVKQVALGGCKGCIGGAASCARQGVATEKHCSAECPLPTAHCPALSTQLPHLGVPRFVHPQPPPEAAGRQAGGRADRHAGWRTGGQSGTMTAAARGSDSQGEPGQGASAPLRRLSTEAATTQMPRKLCPGKPAPGWTHN